MNFHFGQTQNNNNNHLFFLRCSKNNLNQPNNHNSNQIHSSNIENVPISLLDNPKYNIFEYLQRTFAIKTNNGTCFFNPYFLKDTSPVISKYMNENPGKMEYFIDIQDDFNVLGKFEKMYQGQYVEFDEEELLISHKITKILNITRCANFLKPESLKGPEESYSSNNSNNQMTNNFGVEIDKNRLCGYLRNECPKIFRIKTNKKEYYCNIFAVYSSAVIRKLLLDNPSTTEYVYDFDDEFEEFETISNFFNFNSIVLTKNNIDSVKAIAEDLEIDVIYDNIDKFINATEKVSKSIDEQQTIVDSIEEIFDLLYNIKEKTVEKVKRFILDSKWSKTKDNVKELVAFMIQVVRTEIILHPYIYDLIDQLDKESNKGNELSILVPFFAKQLRNMLFPSKHEFLSLIVYNKVDSCMQLSSGAYAFYYYLYKKGVVSKDDLLKDLSKNQKNSYAKLWFLPEWQSVSSHQSSPHCFGVFINNDNQDEHVSDVIEQYIMTITPDKIELYKKMRDEGEPDDELAKALRHDDVDKVQAILSKIETSHFNRFIRFNMFETFTDDQTITYINYAAAYGSIKCFKYLLLNHELIDSETFKYAVHGKNIEIVKIVEQKEKEMKKNCFSTISIHYTINKTQKSSENDEIFQSIIMHQNDLFDWIFEQRYTNQQDEQLIYKSIENGNAHSLIAIVDSGFNLNNMQSNTSIIQQAASYGYHSLAQLLVNLLGENCIKTRFCFDSFCFDNISILKIFLNTMNQNELENVLIYAIGKEWISTQHYFFDTIINKSLKLTTNLAKNLLSMSLNLKTNDTFIYLVDQFKRIDQNFFTNFPLTPSLLEKACSNKNIEAAKILTDILLANKINADYTSYFLSAASADASEICNYFVSKNLPINYEKLTSQVSNLGSISNELFSVIMSQISPEAKEKIIGCFNQAIEKKNKSLVKYLLKENPSIDNALFTAVKTNDVELVDIILNYNSQPSFINKLSPNGTALKIAVDNNNLQIVQRLLSLPGINPNLYFTRNVTPLIGSVYNLNLEIFNAILDFYGENILSQKWQIDRAIMYILEESDSNRRNEKENLEEIESKKNDILKRILEIKGIDHNYHFDNHTFLTYACFKNNIDLVQTLLTFDDIDVNLYEPTRGDSPLIIAVKNNYFDIAKLLIKYPKTDINWRNYFEETALIFAVDENEIEIVDLIINDDKFKPEESRLNYAFFLSTGESSEQLLSMKSLDVNYEAEITPQKNKSLKPMNPTIFNSGFERLNFKNDTFQQALKSEPINSAFGSIEKSLSFGFFRNNSIGTTLINAVSKNDIEKIDLIIHHPSFDKVKSQLKTAIVLSVTNSQLEIFRKLINIIDNDVNICDFDGKSLLYHSVYNESYDILNEIINSPNFDSKKSDIFTAFVQSYTTRRKPNNFIFNDNNNNTNQRSPVEVMSILYDYDKKHDNLIDLTKLLPNGSSFFTVVNFNSSFDENVYDFLIENGADPDQPDQNGIYPLQHAISIDSFGFTKSLIDTERIDLTRQLNHPLNNNDEQNKSFKTTYIHLAAEANNEKIIGLFIDRRLMDINAVNELGDTPLICACKYQRLQVISILFNQDNLDYKHCNKEGLDAIKTARLKSNTSKTFDDESTPSKNEYKDHLITLLKPSDFLFGNNAGNLAGNFTFAFRNMNINDNEDDNNNEEEKKDESESSSKKDECVEDLENSSQGNESAASNSNDKKLIQNQASADTASPGDAEENASININLNNQAKSANQTVASATSPLNFGEKFSLAENATSAFGFNNKEKASTATTTTTSPDAFGFGKAPATFNFNNQEKFATATATTASPDAFGFGKAPTTFNFNNQEKLATATATTASPNAFGFGKAPAEFNFNNQEKPATAAANISLSGFGFGTAAPSFNFSDQGNLRFTTATTTEDSANTFTFNNQTKPATAAFNSDFTAAPSFNLGSQSAPPNNSNAAAAGNTSPSFNFESQNTPANPFTNFQLGSMQKKEKE